MPRKRAGRKQTLLFQPRKVATAIHEAIKRDLSGLTQLYETSEDPIWILANRQSSEFLKKFSDPTESQDHLVDLTYKKFLRVNDHMRHYRDKEFPDVDARIQRGTRIEDKILIRARALMRQVLTDFSEEEWFLQVKNSQGATIGVPFTDTSPEAKLTFPISLTSRVKPLFERYLLFDFQLSRAVEEFNGQQPLAGRYHFVQGSRATTVEKNDRIRRMIAVEPTANMMLQQGLMALLYDRMKVVGLDVESLPDTHKERARVASISGREATIDWSSASDCVSIGLLRYLLPPKWFACFDQIRSPVMELEGSPVDLNMASTMGNAVTFPLETLVFWTIAHGVLQSQNPLTNSVLPEWESLMKVSVFGDDCIVPTSIASEFIRACESVGFIVNDDKSFYDEAGRFRESCGGDYHAGYDVRPAFAGAPTGDRKSDLEPWLYITLNALIPKYRTCFGVLRYVYDQDLFRVAFGLFKKFGIKPKLVPNFYPDDAGLHLSDDLWRFVRSYGVDFAPLSVSRHGSISFNFVRYQYRQRIKKDPGIRLALWLKKPSKSIPLPLFDKSRTWRARRVGGGYVVAKGLTAHWTVLPLDRGVEV